MDIRPATIEDTAAIIDLFRISLGEQGGAPEIDFWEWKHHRNPFGQSPTLLAFEGHKLIGLRTFLRWRFRFRNERFDAYRAVDTATHPDFRGKGIFRKLTLALISSIQKDHPAVIFNTPNKLSRPGYLKMGWKVLGKTPLVVQPLPIHFLMNRLRNSNSEVHDLDWPATLQETWNSISPNYHKLLYNCITTDISFSYLQWRYHDIPDFRYSVYSDTINGDSCILLYRIKLGKLKELRLTDIFFNRPNPTLIKKCIVTVTRKHNPDVVTLLEDHSGLIKSVLPFGFISAHRFGLPITYKHVNSQHLTDLMAQSNQLYVGAGSIELL